MDDFEEIRLDANNVIRRRRKPKSGELRFHPEAHVSDESQNPEQLKTERVYETSSNMHHEEEKQMEEKSMYTNPALPVTVPAYGGFGEGRLEGFRPADAALVQSGNLFTLAAQMATSNQMNAQFQAQQMKENALLTATMIGQLSDIKAAVTAGVAPAPARGLLDDIILLSLINRLIPTPTPPVA